MKVKIIFSNAFRKNFIIIVFLYIGLLNLHSQTISPTLTIDLSKPGHAISPALYNSILFEEVNHGVDGGFYAQLIKNGSFEDNNNMDGWSLIDPGSSEGTLLIQSSAETTQLNSDQAHCLKLKITSVDFGSVGAANEGYWGIRLDNKTTYRVSFFARKDPDFKGTITVKLESNDKAFSGYRGFVYASSDPLTPTENWQKFTCDLTPAGITHVTGENRFVIYGSSTGSLYFDDIRVMPPTFNDRPNGLRIDLAEKLSDLHPKFIRFPGGLDVGKSKTLDYSWNWKKTIGPVEQRPGMKAQQWNYRNSQQFGLDEIFQMCEDLGADPVYCIPIGNISSVATIDELQPFIQDALDLIEYSNGDSLSTKWGKQRSANGHPMPYNLKYIEVGNERFYTRGYHERYSIFYSAIKKAYPEIKIIITDLIEDQKADILEENFNRTQREYFFLRLPNRYDKYDRKGPEIIVGQYSLKETGQSKNDAKNNQGNLMAAVVEAAFLTGCERNSDIVVSTNFGTLSANINAPLNLGPCLFYNNSVSCYAIPSYYMLKMFVENTGDVVLPYTLSLGVLSNSLYVAPSKVNSNGDIIIKVVNTTENISNTKIILKGIMKKIDSNIKVITLSSNDPSDENSIDKPLKVIPAESKFTAHGAITDSVNSFDFPFPARSVSVLRIKTSKESDEK